MKLFMRVMVAMVALLGATSVLAFGMARYVEGVHYTRSPSAEPAPGTVVEFFSLGCPHCANLEPALEQWLQHKPANANFSRIPATWNPNFQYLARLYYALEELGGAEQHIQAVFDAIHRDRKLPVNDEQAVTLLAGLGYDKAKAAAAWNSPALDDKLLAAAGQLGRHRISGVPAFLVSGQYITSVSMAGSPEELFEVIEFLLSR